MSNEDPNPEIPGMSDQIGAELRHLLDYEAAQEEDLEGTMAEMEADDDRLLTSLVGLADELGVVLPDMVRDAKDEYGVYSLVRLERFRNGVDPHPQLTNSTARGVATFITFLVAARGQLEDGLEAGFGDDVKVGASMNRDSAVRKFLWQVSDDAQARVIVELTNRYFSDRLSPLDVEEKVANRLLEGRMQAMGEHVVKHNTELRLELRSKIREIIEEQLGLHDDQTEILSPYIFKFAANASIIFGQCAHDNPGKRLDEIEAMAQPLIAAMIADEVHKDKASEDLAKLETNGIGVEQIGLLTGYALAYVQYFENFRDYRADIGMGWQL